jgi:RNA polymerase sigma factor (sigma-70 family)
MINNVLMQLRKAKKEFPSDDMDSVAKSDSDEKEDVPQSLEEKVRNEDFSQAELVEMIHALPEGYSRVMNMYVIDKYKHREIAKIMGISEGTSKSQLNRARKLMKQKLLELVLENKGCSQVPD